MGIVTESTTYIEKLLKEALLKENIPFEEQYCIYSGERFRFVKYVGDFYIQSPKARLIVECDGFTYHATHIRKQKERDKWLSTLGYKVLHFSTKQLKYEMSDVIGCIKANLKSDKLVEPEHRHNPQPKTGPTPTVALFCYYLQKDQDLFCVYKFKDLIRGKWSNERKVLFLSIPIKTMPSVAIYNALLNLKREELLKVYYNGDLLSPDFETVRTIKQDFNLFPKGTKLIKSIVQFEYCNIEAYHRSCLRENIRTIRELKSRCLQIANQEMARNGVAQRRFEDLLETYA